MLEFSLGERLCGYHQREPQDGIFPALEPSKVYFGAAVQPPSSHLVRAWSYGLWLRHGRLPASWSTVHSPSPQLCGVCRILSHWPACLPLPQFLRTVGPGLSHRIRPVDLFSLDVVLDFPGVSSSQIHSKVGGGGGRGGSGA